MEISFIEHNKNRYMIENNKSQFRVSVYRYDGESYIHYFRIMVDAQDTDEEIEESVRNKIDEE